ncbi:uncharacterized protein [Arachis hypogaea]|uniref:uncharacterized protein n=1 Tax=Arachis hypogaea TaxID=3818 RepID=UPI003B2203F8
MSGIKINEILIDGGAAISLLPERMLTKVGKHPDDLVPTNISVTDFSGASTSAKGLVTLGVKVGSSDRNTVFVVVSSKASYNALLGRDWVHGVGVVPSTVYQSILLWNDDGKPEVFKVDLNLYVKQLHVDFRAYSPKLKPLNVDKLLNSFNCEGCYLTSEGLSVKLRYPQLNIPPTGWDLENEGDSSDEVESFKNVISSSSHRDDSISLIEFSHSLSSFCFNNFSNVVSQTASEIVEVHCIANEAVVNPAKDQVCFNLNESVDLSFDCIYDLEPLDFEKYSVKGDEHSKDMLVDSAAGNEILSFMDGYSGYNQIFIAEDDVSKTTF